MEIKYVFRALIGPYVNFHYNRTMWPTNLHEKFCRWVGRKKSLAQLALVYQWYLNTFYYVRSATRYTMKLMITWVEGVVLLNITKIAQSGYLKMDPFETKAAFIKYFISKRKHFISKLLYWKNTKHKNDIKCTHG